MERRVLVIDDDDLSREVLGLLLAEDGFRVETASSGEEALALLESAEARVDAVLMDLQMPGISGGELVDRLRGACGPRVRLLAMSGARRIEADGADAFLLKPFSMVEFRETLDRVDRRGEEVVEETDDVAGRGRGNADAVTEGGVGGEALTAEVREAEVLDPKVFGAFQGMLGEGALRDLYRVCVEDAEKQLLTLRGALLVGDGAGFRKGAHAIKGSLGMVGAGELQRICGDFEERGIDSTSASALNEFPAAIGRLRRMLIAHGVQL